MNLDAIIEIPKGSQNKYEMDLELGRIRLDRTLFTATSYPSDYGFFPGTLAEDGDPLDVLVLVDAPTFPGCVVSVRPVAVFWMRDEHGPDAKVLAVPADDVRFAEIRDVADLPRHLLGRYLISSTSTKTSNQASRARPGGGKAGPTTRPRSSTQPVAAAPSANPRPCAGPRDRNRGRSVRPGRDDAGSFAWGSGAAIRRLCQCRRSWGPSVPPTVLLDAFDLVAGGDPAFGASGYDLYIQDGGGARRQLRHGADNSPYTSV